MKLSELIAQLEETADTLKESLRLYGERNVTISPELLRISHKILPNGDITIEVKHET